MLCAGPTGARSVAPAPSVRALEPEPEPEAYDLDSPLTHGKPRNVSIELETPFSRFSESGYGSDLSDVESRATNSGEPGGPPGPLVPPLLLPRPGDSCTLPIVFACDLLKAPTHVPLD